MGFLSINVFLGLWKVVLFKDLYQARKLDNVDFYHSVRVKIFVLSIFFSKAEVDLSVFCADF